ncbi:MAG: GspE/PulE family protein [Snowella sp.]|nr:GspE/PulE family protein [Snowella sp.]
MTFSSDSRYQSFLSPFSKQLIQSGYISLSQMQQALALIESSGRSLPEVITEITGETLPPELLQQYQSHQRFKLTILYGVNFFDPQQEEIDIAAIAPLLDSYLPLTLCRQHQILPLKKIETDQSYLSIAMVDPDNLLAQDELQRLHRFGLKYQRRGITLEDYQTLLEQYLSHYSQWTKSPAREATTVDITEIMEDNPPGLYHHPPEEELNQPVPAQEAPIITLVNKILILGLREKANEIHLDPQESKLTVRIRQGGNLRPLIEPLPKKVVPAVIQRLKVMAGMDISQSQIPQRARLRKSYSGHPVFFFISTLPSFYGEKVIVRIVETVDHFPEFQDLCSDRAVQEQFQNLVTATSGLVLITGPTYAGKSTTIEAFLGQQHQQGASIGTIEDPIRRTWEGFTQVEVNPEKGITYATALKALSEQSLAVLVVDNIEDQETAQAVLKAVHQGHLVFAGLHAKDTATAIAQMEEWVEPNLLAENLLAVVNQRLLRRVCPTCRLQHQPEVQELEKLGLTPNQRQSSQFYRANTLNQELVGQLQLKGRLCRQCSGAGYHGQVGVYEILRLSPSLRRLISQKKAPEALRTQALKEGMISLVQDGLVRVTQGETTLEELLRVFPDALLSLAGLPSPGTLPEGFQERLDHLEQSLAHLTQSFHQFKQLFGLASPDPTPFNDGIDLTPDLLALESLQTEFYQSVSMVDSDDATMIGDREDLTAALNLDRALNKPLERQPHQPLDHDATMIAPEEDLDSGATVINPFKSIMDPW